MSQPGQFDFCPQCGAVARDGVCQSCGYKIPNFQFSQDAFDPNQNFNVQNTAANYSAGQPVQPVTGQSEQQGAYTSAGQSAGQGAYTNAGQPEYNAYYTAGQQQSAIPNQPQPNYYGAPVQPPKKNHTGLIIAIVIIVMVVVIGLVALLGVLFYGMIEDSAKEPEPVTPVPYEEEVEPEIKDESEEEPEVDSNYYYGHGEEGLSADYYEYLTDYIRYDLDYSVDFDTYEESVDTTGYDVEIIYPIISGDDVPNLTTMNLDIYQEVLYGQEMAKEYDCGVYISGYVTYMDEDVLSIVYSEYFTFEDDTYYESIFSVNYDMKTGTVRDNVGVLDISDDFLTEYKSRALAEIGSDAQYIMDTATDDELKEFFQDETDLILFYTPLGMEIGINYHGYWATCTFKDYENYLANDSI